MIVHKVYLGDSVYAALQDGLLMLTTENGLGPTNTIYLEPEVIQNLQMYLEEKDLRVPSVASPSPS